MQNEFKKFNEKFQVKKFLIYENEDWFLFLNPFQPTLGALIVYSKFEAIDIEDINDIQSKSLIKIKQIGKRLLEKVFSPCKFNFWF